MKIAETLQNYHASSIPDVELIQFLAGRGAEKLLATMPLNEAMRLEITELERTVGKKSAAKLAAAFEFARRSTAPRMRKIQLTTPQDVQRYLRPQLAHLSIEEFHVLLLDTRHRLMRDVMVAKGGLAACAISPRDVFDPAIREAAPALILAHNHPSGDPSPSRDDIDLTRRLVEGARVLGLSIVDHIVIADGGFASLAEMGKI